MNGLVVPYVKSSKVVNRRILYADEVLSTENFGEYVFLEQIDNILEKDIDSKIREVISKNLGVTFYMVQYSKSCKCLYFYTNGLINKDEHSIKEIDEMSYDVYLEILHEIISVYDENDIDDSISLYDILKVGRMFHEDYIDTIFEYDYLFEKCIKECDEIDAIKFVNFDFDEECLYLKVIINGREIIVGCFKDLTFIENGLSNSEIFKLSKCFGKYIFDLIIKLSEFKCFKKDNYLNVASLNSKFLVDFDSMGIMIYLRDQTIDEFNMRMDYDKMNGEYFINSCRYHSGVLDNASSVYKRILVNTSDIPSWYKEIMQENKLVRK